MSETQPFAPPPRMFVPISHSSPINRIVTITVFVVNCLPCILETTLAGGLITGPVLVFCPHRSPSQRAHRDQIHLALPATSYHTATRDLPLVATSTLLQAFYVRSSAQRTRQQQRRHLRRVNVNCPRNHGSSTTKGSGLDQLGIGSLQVVSEPEVLKPVPSGCEFSKFNFKIAYHIFALKSHVRY